MTILIVDDEEIVRKLIRVALKGIVDAVLLEANETAGALKIAREHYGSIDILISDVVMPGRMSGTEMAAQLSHARPEMKVVLISGYAPETLTMQPSWYFIQKPFGPASLARKVREVLDQSRIA